MFEDSDEEHSNNSENEGSQSSLSFGSYWEPTPARREPPSISGLHFPDVKITQDLAVSLFDDLVAYFKDGSSNQVMLFGSGSGDGHGSLPSFITSLVEELSSILESRIPQSTHSLLFPSDPLKSPYPARQVILNLYRPGEGITPHIDLLGRFGDGIILLSLVSGIVMDFTRDRDAVSERYSLWLPPRSVLVLEGEARYEWKHGIQARKQDFVVGEEPGSQSQWADRSLRMSITIRWLLPGAEVVGDTLTR